jgi:hypothetical protein
MSRISRHLFLIFLTLSALPLQVPTPTAKAQAQLLFRILVAAALHSQHACPTGGRTKEIDDLAKCHVFNSIPRNSGQQFIVVTDDSKFKAAQTTVQTSHDDAPIILFSNDSVAAVPASITSAINEKCRTEGWAMLEYVRKDSDNELYDVFCGRVPDPKPKETSITVPRPAKSGAYEGEIKVQNIKYLQARLKTFEVLNQGEIRTVVALKNTVVALKNIGSNNLGLALFGRGCCSGPDVWKFFPQPTGSVTDNAGNKYEILRSEGMQFAQTNNSMYWTVLGPNEETSITLFATHNNRVGTSFNLSVTIWLTYFLDGSSQRTETFSVQMNDIKPIRL